jgi:hypothetical protein
MKSLEQCLTYNVINASLLINYLPEEGYAQGSGGTQCGITHPNLTY